MAKLIMHGYVNGTYKTLCGRRVSKVGDATPQFSNITCKTCKAEARRRIGIKK